MKRMIFAGVALALSMPALASEAYTFERDGVTYRYTVSERSGSRIIKGTRSDGGDYRFRVRNGQVTGWVDSSYVSFPVSDVKHDVETAAR